MQVRRKDVIDLFLGTGLGPRAYAIIEQGMISRIIEAKPEEVRGFLEEAAGVTKYRERRKETEGRLCDARDNLTRLDDIPATNSASSSASWSSRPRSPRNTASSMPACPSGRTCCGCSSATRPAPSAPG